MSDREGRRLDLHRIAALPYNHYFKQEVEEMRERYGIPSEPDKASDWYESHKKEHQGKKPPKGRLKSKVPLEREIIFLLARFRVPLTSFAQVVYYVLFLNPVILDPIFGNRPRIHLHADDKRGLLEFRVEVYDLNIWTSKKQWERLWTEDVAPALQSLKENYAEVTGDVAPGKKAQSLRSLGERMKRNSKWYHLTRIQGLTADEALRKWEPDPEDEPGPEVYVDATTLLKAVKEFEEIITPLPVESMNF